MLGPIHNDAVSAVLKASADPRENCRRMLALAAALQATAARTYGRDFEAEGIDLADAFFAARAAGARGEDDAA